MVASLIWMEAPEYCLDALWDRTKGKEDRSKICANSSNVIERRDRRAFRNSVIRLGIGKVSEWLTIPDATGRVVSHGKYRAESSGIIPSS